MIICEKYVKLFQKKKFGQILWLKPIVALVFMLGLGKGVVFNLKEFS